MATKQKLGIELSLTLDSKFSDLIKKIESSFANIDIKGFETKIQGVEGKVGKLAKDIADLTKGSAKQIQLDINTASANQKMVQATQVIENYKNVVVDANGKVVSALKEQQRIQREIDQAYAQRNAQINGALKEQGRVQTEVNKAYSQRTAQVGTADKIAKEVEAAYKQEERTHNKKLNLLSTLQKKEEAITASIEKGNQKELESTLRKIDAENAAHDRQQQLTLRSLARYQEAKLKADASMYMASYTREGNTPVNGGWARTSAVNFAKNNSIDDIHAAAIKYGETLKANSAQLKQGEEYLASLAARGKAHWNGQEISIQQYRKNIRELNGELSETSKRTRTFLDSFGSMARALTEFYLIRGVLFAIRNQIQDVSKTLLDFNQSLYDTAAISGGSIESLKNMEKAAFNIATTSRFTATQVMEMTKILAQAGVAAKDLPIATKITSIFATGANATPAQAVDLMTTAMNVWEIQASDSIRIANTLTATLNASKLEAGGLSTAFNYLANQGSQMNMSLEETAGIIATLSNVGVKPSTIGTGASGLLAAFAAPAPRFAALLKEFKIGLEEVNPMTHSFAEIIGRLEKAAIPTEAILASLDKRIARTLVSALNAGQQGFELMTRAVTNTDAALIANYKVMEGVRAQFNVIKSEFAVAVKSITDDLSGVFSAALRALRVLVLGLGTDGGKLALTLGTVAAALTAVSVACKVAAVETSLLARAILALKAVTPEVWFVVGALTAVTGALYLFGAKKLQQKESDEAFVKNLAAIADRLQQGEQGLIGFMNGLTKTQRSQKGYIKLTGDQTTELVKLINKYPDYLGKLDLEHLTLEKLITATNDLYEARKKNAASAADTFNREEYVIRDRKRNITQDPEWNKVVNQVKSKIPTANTADPLEILKEAESLAKDTVSFGTMYDDSRKYLRSFVERHKKDVADIAASTKQKDTIQPSIDANFIIKDGLAEEVKAAPRNRTSSGWKAPNNGADKALEKAENIDEQVQAAINEMRRKLSQLSIAEKKIKLDQLKEDLKTEKDLAAYKTLAKEVINEEAAEQEVEARIRINNKMATDLKGKIALDKDGFGADITAGKGVSQERATELSQLAQQQLDAERKNIKAKAKVDSDKIDGTQLPASETRLSKDTTLRDEKIENARLAKVQAELQVRKDLAVTAEQLHMLELESLANQEQSLINLEKIYQARVNDVEQDFEKYTDLVEYDAALETAKDNLEAVRIKLKGINAEQKEMSNTDFFHNFNKGASASLKSMGDFKSNTQQLGQDIATTGLNGMVNLIDQSITKLSQLEWSWKSFSQTLGNVMKDIAADLQKYYIKLMVIWAAEQMVGLFRSAGKTSMPVSNSPSGISQPAFNASPSMFASGEFAEGGEIVGGIAGKDSVPILTMPGEFVVKASAVSQYGVDFMHDLNSGRVRKFAEGGPTGRVAASGGSDEQAATIQIINLVDPSSIPQTTDAQIINVINYDLARKGPTYKSVKLALA